MTPEQLMLSLLAQKQSNENDLLKTFAESQTQSSRDLSQALVSVVERLVAALEQKECHTTELLRHQSQTIEKLAFTSIYGTPPTPPVANEKSNPGYADNVSDSGIRIKHDQWGDIVGVEGENG